VKYYTAPGITEEGRSGKDWEGQGTSDLQNVSTVVDVTLM